MVEDENRLSSSGPVTPLLFHRRCGDHAQILAGGTAACRKRYKHNNPHLFLSSSLPSVQIHLHPHRHSISFASLFLLFLSPLPLYSAESQFDHGVVISNHPLSDNKLFEVEISEMMSRWSGSIVLGVTTHKLVICSK